MSLLKNIAGETAIYGLSSILGRAVNFLLVPLYTSVLPKELYGNISELYAYVGFLMVLMVYRFETAFFRFGAEKQNRDQVFSTAIISLLVSSTIIALGLTLFSVNIAALMGYQVDEAIFIRFFAWILFFDVMVEVPLARLRLENKAVKFASIRLINIGVNIGLNLFFLLLCPYLLSNGPESLKPFINSIYAPDFQIGYIFLSNLVASFVSLILVLPEFRKTHWKFDKKLWKKMSAYAFPLVIVGLAGIVNEMLDRALLKWLLPYDMETNEGELGIYSACYKLAMLMALFTQAYRYAAEPFFFKNKKHKNAPEIYALIARYFVIVGTVGFLVIMLFMDYVQLVLRSPEYRVGLHVVPILLIANLFLGLYYNLSVWYKLTDRTSYAAWISIGGAIVTIALNIYWIPRIGYTGSAWATLICYGSMTLASYFIGKKYYPLLINWPRIFFYMALSLGIYFGDAWIQEQFQFARIIKNTLHFMEVIIFMVITYIIEIKTLRKWVLVR